MKKLYFDTLILALLLMVVLPTDLRAQASSTLTFSKVETVAAATDKGHESATGCVYLYNVGSGEYLSVGGDWGTQPMTHEVGMALYINTGTESTPLSSSDGVYYQIGSNITGNGVAGFIGLVRYGFDNYTSDIELYADRNGLSGDYDGVVRMIFTEVSTDDRGPIYTISLRDYHAGSSSTAYLHDSNGDWVEGTSTDCLTTYYLVAQEGDNQLINAVESDESEGSTTSATAMAENELAQWRLVTRGDFIADFQNVNTGTEKANATFLVTDQNFNRNNANEAVWDTTGVVTIGCGSSTVDQATYGRSWLATIKGKGSVSQDIESVASGWYQLIIKGFSTGTSAAKIYISYTSDGNETTHTAALNIFTNTETYSDFTDQATIQALDDQLIAANSQYQTETSVMLFVPNGSTFTIGVTAESSDCGYTLFDDVQLYFYGQSEEIALDEEWDINELSYINWQVSTYTKTLYLKRSLNEGKWNSLILPVNVPLENLKAAFGDDTQLCKLTEVKNDGADIYFTTVLGDDSSTGIEANKMYIIKPSKLTQSDATDTYYYTIKDNSTNSLETEATYHFGSLTGPYFTIPGVTLTEKISSEGTVKDPTIASTVDNGIYMQGTYVKDIQVPQYSYAINANDGQWYYLTTSSKITSKGYRAWICTGNTDETEGSDTQAAVATLHFDDESVTDGIDGLAEELGIETAGSIYSLSGQKVSSGSLKGLSKGIYIKNGKKYIVK